MKKKISFRRYYLDRHLEEIKFHGNVLDVGGKKDCKRGSFIPPLNKIESWKYLNIDKSTNPDYCCSAESVPVDDNTFDFILLTEVIEHLQNPEIVIRECFRILNKEGQIIISIPFLYPIHADPFDYQRWTDYKIKIELENAGFSEIKINTMGSLFAVIRDLIDISYNSASRNRNALKNKVYQKCIRPITDHVFIKLDKKYEYKSKKITTGYFVNAKKSCK